MGRKQQWFPQNYVMEVDPGELGLDPDQNPDQMPLGNLQKGSIDILGAEVTFDPNPDRIQAMSGMEWVLRIKCPDQLKPFEVSRILWRNSQSKKP